MPERSSIEPMKTNKGTAARTKLEATSSIFSDAWKTKDVPKVQTPNTAAVAIIENATGKPRKSRVRRNGKMSSEV